MYGNCHEKENKKAERVIRIRPFGHYRERTSAPAMSG